MSAQILQFPQHGDRRTVRVEYADGCWRVIHGNRGWPCLSREAATREALIIADQADADTIVVRSRGREAGD
jgi:hypothetical protein